uniref:Uncharacterized protein n=1 Tax=Anguilla anguilla TaxID=7936 RepID=A0A0E9R964_ANGAN
MTAQEGEGTQDNASSSSPMMSTNCQPLPTPNLKSRFFCKTISSKRDLTLDFIILQRSV